MGLKELEAKIRADAEKEMAEIERKAQSGAENVAATYRLQAETEYTSAISRAEREASLVRKQIVWKAKAELCENVELEKNKMIAEVFSNAKSSIFSLTKAGKKKVLDKLTGDSILFDGGIIEVDREFKDLVSAPDGFKVKASDIGFGLVLTSSDGLVRVDNRLDVVLERMKARMKPKVNKILFD